jgi:hypothetical protein
LESPQLPRDAQHVRVPCSSHGFTRQFRLVKSQNGSGYMGFARVGRIE